MTKKILLQLRPCADGLAFAESLNFDFAKIYDECQRGDWLVWLLRKSGNMDKRQVVSVALVCAERVLEIFEESYPDDKRPRLALEAVREWLKDPAEKNQRKCRAADAAAAAAANAAAYAAAAAYDANAAAYDAYAANAAAYAAYAAAYAAYAAAYAAAAAYDANAAAYADAANAAANAARLKEHKWQADKIRELIPNPFKL